MIIDFHTHLFPPTFDQKREEICRNDATFNEMYSKSTSRIVSTRELIKSMDYSGIQASVIMGIGWTHHSTAKLANDYLLQAASEYPDRLIPFCSVNPTWGELAALELERCAKQGAKGVGELHPDTQGFDIIDPEIMQPMMDCAEALDMPLIIHSSEPIGHQYPGKGKTTPDRLWSFIQNFTRNKIVCAHWGGGLPFYALMPEVERLFTNVYFDTAATPFLYQPKVFDTVTVPIGSHKILFGTDYPLLPQRRVIQQIEQSSLSKSDQAAMLGINASKLLGL